MTLNIDLLRLPVIIENFLRPMTVRRIKPTEDTHETRYVACVSCGSNILEGEPGYDAMICSYCQKERTVTPAPDPDATA